MNTPLVNIVIPTCGRPQYLLRAIESALTCGGDDVEVIVVPNGPDQSWKEALSQWLHDKRVRISPVKAAHANVARNHGMQLAQGKYIRFLDDDDYLLPAAARQVEVIEHNGAEICSGLLANMDQDGISLGQLGFPSSRDFLCAAVRISGFTLPTGNLFLRNSLAGVRWDINVHRRQDYAWMLDLAAMHEWNWVHLEEQVGVWFQHDLERTSTTKSLTGRENATIERLLRLHDRIDLDGRDTAERRRSIAEALWCYVRPGFPYHPIYWTRIAYRAKVIDPNAEPLDPFYQRRFIRLVNPIILEWLLFPIRRITRMMRDIKYRWRGNDYRRRL